MSGNLYFNWDGVPSVVVDGGDNKNSLLRYMPSGSDSWVQQMLCCFLSG